VIGDGISACRVVSFLRGRGWTEGAHDSQVMRFSRGEVEAEVPIHDLRDRRRRMLEALHNIAIGETCEVWELEQALASRWTCSHCGRTPLANALHCAACQARFDEEEGSSS